MTDPERDHFVRRIRDLERRLRRWRLACLVALGLVAFPIVLGGLAGVRLQQEQAALVERLRADAEENKAKAEATLRRAEAMLREEEAGRRGAADEQVGAQPENHTGKDKD
jgi:hypothetical protein